MTVTITAFERSPDRGRGLARDMAVRWALEEVGRRYAVRRLSFAALAGPAHRAVQPFGQIPTFEEGGLALFESGAIVQHVAERWPGLLPAGADARARAIGWIHAATATVEPPIVEREMAMLLERDEPWHEARLPRLEARIAVRLDQLAAWLGERAWLDGAFGAGDLMMVTVLRRLGGDALLAAQPRLAAYVARGEARPAFVRAFAAQRAAFEAAGGAAAAD